MFICFPLWMNECMYSPMSQVQQSYLQKPATFESENSSTGFACQIHTFSLKSLIYLFTIWQNHRGYSAHTEKTIILSKFNSISFLHLGSSVWARAAKIPSHFFFKAIMHTAWVVFNLITILQPWREHIVRSNLLHRKRSKLFAIEFEQTSLKTEWKIRGMAVMRLTTLTIIEYIKEI